MNLQAIPNIAATSAGLITNVASYASFGAAIALPIAYFLDVISYVTEKNNPYDYLNLCNATVPTSPLASRSLVGLMVNGQPNVRGNCEWKDTPERFHSWLFTVENNFVPKFLALVSASALGSSIVLKVLSNRCFAFASNRAKID
jgi:hypothetical protein